MSDWDVDNIADNAWSSFDEVSWLECDGKGDHIVPDPCMLRGTSFLSGECLPKAGGESTQGVQKISGQICQRIQKLDHPDASIKGHIFTDFEGQEVGYNVKGRVNSPRKGVWCDYSLGSSLAVLPLSASSRCDSIIKSGPALEPKKEISRYNCEGDIGMCKGDSGYHDDGSDIINSSCRFLLSDICPPGEDLEFLAECQEEVRRDNLLEYGWGNTNNLEDMEKLFSSNESMLSRGFDNNNDGMLWEPPSLTLGDSLESMHQPVPVPESPQFVSSGVVKHFEGNSNPSASVNTESLSNDETGSGEEWSVQRANISVGLKNPCLPVHIDNYTDFRKGNTWETQEASDGGSRDFDNMEDEASHVPEETDESSYVEAFERTFSPPPASPPPAGPPMVLDKGLANHHTYIKIYKSVYIPSFWGLSTFQHNREEGTVLTPQAVQGLLSPSSPTLTYARQSTPTLPTAQNWYQSNSPSLVNKNKGRVLFDSHESCGRCSHELFSVCGSHGFLSFVSLLQSRELIDCGCAYCSREQSKNT